MSDRFETYTYFLCTGWRLDVGGWWADTGNSCTACSRTYKQLLLLLLLLLLQLLQQQQQQHTWAVPRWGRGHVPAPQIHLFAPSFPQQIQKLADRSDVISEVQNATKSKLTALPDPLADGEGARCPLLRTPPPLSALRASFLGSQGLTHCRVGHPTNDRFQM